jgi:hypothetical protein
MIRAGESSHPDGGMGPAGHRVCLGTSALLFIASVATTSYLCQSMPGGMAMPGGWIMSMAWMKMPGQSWLASTASFLGMWVVMMVAMMLPSLVLELLRYRLALRELETIRRSTLAALTADRGQKYTIRAILSGPTGQSTDCHPEPATCLQRRKAARVTWLILRPASHGRKAVNAIQASQHPERPLVLMGTPKIGGHRQHRVTFVARPERRATAPTARAPGLSGCWSTNLLSAPIADT